MNNLQALDKVVNFILEKNLPKEHIFFGTTEEIKSKTKWLSELGSSGLTYDLGRFPDKFPQVISLRYCDISFYFVNTDTL